MTSWNPINICIHRTNVMPIVAIIQIVPVGVSNKTK